MCILPTINSQDQKCFIPSKIRSVWIIAFVLAILAVILLVLTILLFLASQYGQRSMVAYARLTGFVASKYLTLNSITKENRTCPSIYLVIFLCLSTVLFPMGFDSEIIGGSPFQLPTDYRIGSSYVAFIGGTWLTVISAIVTGKMCIPTLVT